ncbi:MAG: redox-sensitive bicupin YhaK (pirin superfamily) [Planctomycetota bacterium]|jgi:redox-sensitive bicupin YhaK (pirin superfamily)
MITVLKSDKRGSADHGWLQARHSFSFAGYYNPERMGHGPLRVFNQDRVASSRGFPSHDHQDMEIVTYVISGQLTHKDSMGFTSTLGVGDVQLMSAGTGVTHSEYNLSEDEELHLLQMWILPRVNGTKPRYEEHHFSLAAQKSKLPLLVSPDGHGDSLTIAQDALFYGAQLQLGEKVSHELGKAESAWIHVAAGQLKIGTTVLDAGDSAAIEAEEEMQIEARQATNVVMWTFPNSQA